METEIFSTDYRERYDMTKEYLSLTSEAVSKLFSGKCTDVEELLKGSTLRKPGIATTFITSDGRDAIQYSIMQNEKSMTEKLSLFEHSSNAGIYKLEDLFIFRNAEQLQEIISWGLKGWELRNSLATALQYNDGSALLGNPLIFGEVLDEGVIAGYKVEQRANGKTTIRKVILSEGIYDDFMSDMYYSEGFVEVIKQYFVGA